MSNDPEISELDITDELIAERRSGGDEMPPDMPAWMAATIINIDRFSHWVGRIVCWLLVPMCLAMVYEVVARK
ncbi:MAG: TRAP transporter permease DctQ, partial [Gammaproteobacteria bacterium]|nr:TRAP transporter permease DctQ [Gammaproteobacteria bacterium]